ncbi:MAG: hypothetical protein JW797_07820 [Bradymonadales bacterium]|nr:hypothetical protein [Bradymonadales bacterium]
MSTYYLAEVIPPIRRFGWFGLSRDQVLLLMAAINEIFLGVDIYLAHRISGTIVPNEWIPIWFGPAAGVLLLFVGLVALRWRSLANVLATVVFLASIGVGLLGAYFHFVRAILPTGPAGEQVTVGLLVWGPPILGPLTFCLVGVLGLSAAWQESPADSGVLLLPGRFQIRMPYSKTRALVFLVGLGILATVLSSVLDHARTPFVNPWLWIPTAVGVLGTIVSIALGLIARPNRVDLTVFLVVMVLLIAVGLLGAYLHFHENLTAGGQFVPERFIRGAPVLAPLLFSNMGALGLIALLDSGR